jgi:hypothetical protein
MILEILRLDHFYNESELIEIAKGKNELPTTFKKGFKQLKRELQWQKRK